jgi:hypothetical protein
MSPIVALSWLRADPHPEGRSGPHLHYGGCVADIGKLKSAVKP